MVINIILLILGLIGGFILAWQIYKRMSQLKKRGGGHRREIDLEDKIWHEEEANFIFKLEEQLSLTIEQKEVIKRMVEAIHKFLYVQKTILLLLDKETDELKIGYSIGLEKDEIENLVLKRDEGIAGFAITQKRPLIVDDLDNDYYLKKLNKEKYLKKSFVSIPLIFQNEVLGLLHVCDKKPDRVFTDRDIVFLINISRTAAIALQNVRLHEQIQNDYLKTITALASAIDARDHYTKWHSENVARYSLEIAKEMGYPTSQMETLRRAALLHDIGKIGTRDEILLKINTLKRRNLNRLSSMLLLGQK